jgi:hypothetical protein
MLMMMFLKSYIKTKFLTPKDTCRIEGASMKIDYIRQGKVESLYIPYRRADRLKLTGHRAYLLANEQVKKEITQNVPYMVCAKDLGGDEIHIYTEDRILKFEKDDVPNMKDD